MLIFLVSEFIVVVILSEVVGVDHCGNIPGTYINTVVNYVVYNHPPNMCTIME